MSNETLKKLKIAVVTINQPSLNSACNLVPYLHDHDVDVYGKAELTHNLDKLNIYKKLDDILEPAWNGYDAIICILALGAVVRKIAPLLKDKSTDPGVLVINLDLSKIIPLLSGHLGGANELSDLLVERMDGCQNFITTATDQTKTLAFDMFAKHNDLEIHNIKQLALISNSLINKKQVEVKTYKSIFDTINIKDNITLVEECTGELCVNITPFNGPQLTLKPSVFLGIGCNRDTSFEDIEKSVLWFLDKHNLQMNQIKEIGSFEAKNDEKGLLEFANKYNFDIKFFNKEEINSLEQEFTPSQATKFFDLKGVSEPSAVLLSKYKELVIKKEVYEGKITLALAV